MTAIQIKEILINSKYNKETLDNTGIYFIKNIISNTIYVGSATCTKGSPSKRGFKGRFAHHINKLYNNTHRNKHLQYAWNKYGYEAFSFEVYKNLPVKECLLEEEYLLKTLTIPLYNICRNSLCRTGKTSSTEIKEMLKKRFSGIPRSEEFRKSLGVPILQFDKQNNLLNEYFGIAEASRQTGTQRQDIGQVCLGHGLTAGGFIWKYKK